MGWSPWSSGEQGGRGPFSGVRGGWEGLLSTQPLCRILGRWSLQARRPLHSISGLLVPAQSESGAGREAQYPARSPWYRLGRRKAVGSRGPGGSFKSIGADSNGPEGADLGRKVPARHPRAATSIPGPG